MSGLQLILTKAEIEFFPWVIESLTIETPEQAKNASDLLALGKALYKSLEDARKAEKQQYEDAVKAVNDQYKPALNRMQLAINRMNDAVIVYHRRIKAESDALLQMQMLEQAQKIAEARETGEVVEIEQTIVQPVGQTVRGNMGSTTIKETADFTLITGEEDKVPRNLCSPDMKKIKAWYAAGFKEIPGVLVTMKSHTISRFS
jgi:hypothetical protein